MYLELSELRQLLPSQEDDLLLRILELRSEGIVGIVAMYPLTKTPTQKPLQEAELLPDRAIAHLAYLS